MQILCNKELITDKNLSVSGESDWIKNKGTFVSDLCRDSSPQSGVDILPPSLNRNACNTPDVKTVNNSQNTKSFLRKKLIVKQKK